jgi:phenylacetic acid degradation operon negative regulatory protein
MYVLKGFIPYTEANLKLSYKPASFFNELERISKKNKGTLRSAYYRLIDKGYIELDECGIPRLTIKGQSHIKLYSPKVLGKGSLLFIIFDIPEEERSKRDRLRKILLELEFEMIQQSVWATKYDYREYISSEIAENDLQNYVQVFEAARLIV